MRFAPPFVGVLGLDFLARNLDGEMTRISSSSNPSRYGNDLFFLGVVGSLFALVSFSLDFRKLRALSASSTRSLFTNSNSVTAVFSASFANSISRCCLASFSACDFLRNASSLSYSFAAFSCLLRTMEISPALVLRSRFKFSRSWRSYVILGLLLIHSLI